MARRNRLPKVSSDLPLSCLDTGAWGVVLSLSDSSPHDRNKLMALGVMPGVRVRVLQRFPSFVIAVGYTHLALDWESASLIQVRAEA